MTEQSAFDPPRGSAGRNLSRLGFLGGLGLAGVAGLSLGAGAPAASADTSPAKVYNVRDEHGGPGATGDGRTDDAPAFQRVFNVIKADSARIALVYVPPGRYRLAAKITHSVDTLCLTIVGDGVGVSTLLCANDQGALQLVHSDPTPQTTIRDLSIVAAATGADHAGTALEIVQPRADQHKRGLILSNVEVRGLKSPKTDPSQWGGEMLFDRGIVVTGARQPLLDGVVVAGAADKAKLEDDAWSFRMRVGIDVSGSYDVTIQNTYVWGARVGIVNDVAVDPPKNAPESMWLYNTSIVNVVTGLVVRGVIDKPTVKPFGVVAEPGLTVDRCHVNARDCGMFITRSDVTVTNCLLYNKVNAAVNDQPWGPYTDVHLAKCMSVIIGGNIFNEPTNAQRIGVWADSVADLIISGNLFAFRAGPAPADAPPNPSKVPVRDGMAIRADGAHTQGIFVTGNMFTQSDSPRFGWPRIATKFGGDAAAAISESGNHSS